MTEMLRDAAWVIFAGALVFVLHSQLGREMATGRAVQFAALMTAVFAGKYLYGENPSLGYIPLVLSILLLGYGRTLLLK